MKKPILFLGLLLIISSLRAEDIFKKHGYEKEILTLSKGRYEEVFNNEEVVKIGSVLLNTKTNKVVKFLEEKNEIASFKAEYSSRFVTVDPLAEKYPWSSSYAFCANNPIRYIDPDGREIHYTHNVSEEFKSQFSQTVQFMNSKGTAGLLKQVHDHPKIIYITEASGRSYFDPKTNTIHWDPTLGVITNEGIIISPATVLNHEIDHAYQEIANPEQKAIDKATPNPNYKNAEEKRVIEGTEQKTARKHGEINAGEVTRTDHQGQRYPTKSPTTTEGKYEITIKPEDKK